MTVHVIGAGLAGLAAATRVVEGGGRVRLYEATGQAGGRCRSWHDDRLDRVVDNGNHLIIGAYGETFRYAERIQKDMPFQKLSPIRFMMGEPASSRFWALGPRPDFLLSKLARGLFFDLVRLSLSGPSETLAGRITDGSRMREFWMPLTLAIFNTPPAQASARLVMRTLVKALRGGIRPYLAPRGLSAALVDPALAWLSTHGVTLATGFRLTGLEDSGSTVTALNFGSRTIHLDPCDRVIVALPPTASRRLLGPEIPHLDSAPIVNIHYRVAKNVRIPDGSPFLGLVGTRAQWLFQRDDVLSVTISGAQSLAGLPPEWIAEEIWKEIHEMVGATSTLPPWRVIKERAATIVQGPQEDHLRPEGSTRFGNVFLAGDWIRTGLPATIESAVLSGHQAADWCFPQSD